MDNSKQRTYIYFFIDLYNSRKNFGEKQYITNIILNRLAKYLNKRFSIDLLSSFEVREGDGVLGGTKKLELIVEIYEACLEFKYTKEFESINLEEVEPDAVKFYFGAGIGNITTGQHTFISVHDINGTAISNAKQASDVAKNIILYNLLPKRKVSQDLEYAISKRGDFYYRFQDVQFYIITDNYLDKLLNPSFYLAYEKYISTKKQNELFQMKKRYPNLELYRIGEKLGYDKSVGNQKLSTQISNLLNKSNFNSQQNLLRDIKIYLRQKTLNNEVEE